MVTGWFTRLVAVLAILGVIAFDGISVASAHFQVNDDAGAAARAAADAYHQPGATTQTAVAAALQRLSRSETLVAGSFQVSSNGAITLKVRRTAKSLVLRLLSATRQWAVVTETGTADPAT